MGKREYQQEVNAVRKKVIGERGGSKKVTRLQKKKYVPRSKTSVRNRQKCRKSIRYISKSKSHNLNKSNGSCATASSVISVNRARFRETITGLIDKLSFPQPTKGLVAGHVRVIIEPGKNFSEILGALGIGGVQKPELLQKYLALAEF